MSIRTAKMFLCFIAVLALLLPVRAAALPLFDIEGAVGGWRVSPSGGMAYEGETLDLEDDLNFDDGDEIFGRLKINTPSIIPNLYLMATPLEYEEKTTRTKSFKFGGKEFKQDIDFKSRLTLDHYDVGLFYNVPLLESLTLDRLNLEVGLNARILDAEAEVEQEAEGQRLYEKESATIPVPMIYLGLGVYPVERFGLEAEVRGMSYSDYEILSMIGRVKVKALGPVFVSGGYRYDTYDIEDDDLIVDVDFSGPFLETGVSF